MRAKEIEYEMSESEYEDVLDEIYGDVQIAGLSYSTGQALREIDPTAFRCGKVDYEAEQPSKWECGECGAEYDNEDEAEDCCKESCDSCGGLFPPDELPFPEHMCAECKAESNDTAENEEA